MKHIVTACIAGIALMACSPSATETATPGEVAASDVAPEAAAPPTPPPVGSDPAVPDTCGMAQHAALVGQPITSEGVPAEGPNVRHLRPDSQMTMDFSPQRLNIDIDADGIITGFRCL